MQKFIAGPHEMNELVMDSTQTTFLISRRTSFRKGVPRLLIINKEHYL